MHRRTHTSRSARAMIVFALLASYAATGAASSAQRVIPNEARHVWLDPAGAFARQKSKRSQNYFEIKRFPITSQHIALLRQARFAWDVTEIGAPMLDLEKPFGREDLLAQLGDVFGDPTPRVLARRHVEMMFAVGALLQHGELAPGVYTPRNVSSVALRAPMVEPGGALVPLATLGLTVNGSFTFKAEHRQLLKVLTFDWPSRSKVEDLLADGAFPTLHFDAKRPYGDRSHYAVDMAIALGRRDVLQKSTDGAWFLSPFSEPEFQNLHRQMLFALQVFLENAAIKPGAYTWAKP